MLYLCNPARSADLRRLISPSSHQQPPHPTTLVSGTDCSREYMPAIKLGAIQFDNHVIANSIL